MLRAELKTETKFLCGCPIGEKACPYCVGLPGALALPNRAAVDAAFAAAEELQCALSGSISFLRGLDEGASRGARLATTAFGKEGALGGCTVSAVWLEEAAGGQAVLCVETDAPAAALDDALERAGIGASPATVAEWVGAVWAAWVDQPGVRLP